MAPYFAIIQEHFMSGRSLRGLTLVVLTFAVVALTACSDDTEVGDVDNAVSQAQSDAADVCDKLDDLDSALDKTASLSASSTVDEAKQAQEEVENAVDEVANSTGDAARSRVAAIETATQAVKDSLDRVEGDQTLGQVASAVMVETSTINTALSGLRLDTNCSS
jgi:hypothetical protein